LSATDLTQLSPPVLKQERIKPADGSRGNSQNVPPMYPAVVTNIYKIIFLPDVIFLKGKEVQKAQELYNLSLPANAIDQISDEMGTLCCTCGKQSKIREFNEIF
jgi:hypothetical protein